MMSAIKRVATEGLILAVLVGLGLVVWMLVMGRYEDAYDAYWTSTGHRPADPSYQTPILWQWPIVFAPYLSIMAARVLLRVKQTRPLRAD